MKTTPDALNPMQVNNSTRRNIGSYLLLLLDNIRESGLSAYVDLPSHSGLERLIILQLGREGPLPFINLQLAIGHDKGQVSRTLKTMQEIGFVNREHLRAPFTLTPEGVKIHNNILKITTRRTQELLTNVSIRDRQWLYTALLHLVTNASMDKDALFANLFENENSKPNNVFHYGEQAEDDSSSIKIIPKLYRLLFLIRQHAQVSYKEKLNITSFESEIIINIKHHEPTTITTLSSYVRRDKGQIGRTVKNLCDSGLLIRKPQTPDIKRKSIYLTEKGDETYLLQQVLSWQVDDIILSGMADDEIEKLFTLFQQLNTNALDM